MRRMDRRRVAPAAREERSAAAKAALGVDDLAGDPLRVVGGEPADEAGGVRRLAPAAERHVADDPGVVIRAGVAGVGRAGVYGIDGDAAVDQQVREAGGELVQSAFRGDVGDLPDDGGDQSPTERRGLLPQRRGYDRPHPGERLRPGMQRPGTMQNLPSSLEIISAAIS